MIRSFKDKNTEALFQGTAVATLRAIRAQAERRLQILDSATTLEDLAGLPGNRLAKLVGDRRGQHSIRISRQWRICFVWHTDGPTEVEIVDYH